MKKLAILGSTGSIGQSTLSIVEQFPDRYSVVSLAAGRNLDEAFGQAVRRRSASALRGDIEALNPGPLFVRCLPHIVTRLQIVPKAGMGSERVRQAQRHVGRNARRAVENARKRGA